MYEGLKETIAVVTDFLNELDQTVTDFCLYFGEENVEIRVPNGYLLPMSDELDYKYKAGKLTVLPLEFASYIEDEYAVYSEVVGMREFLESLTSSINGGKFISNEKEVIGELEFFVKVKRNRLDVDKKGFVSAKKIINTLKSYNTRSAEISKM